MLSTAPTPYDFRFTLFGIPVRVSAWFWLLGSLLGFDLVKSGVEYFIAWLVVVFVSVLVHELGHALVAKAFGYTPRILLYHFGGLAMYEPDSRYTRTKSIAVTLAGPGAGFTLFAVALAFSFGMSFIEGSMSPKSFHVLDQALGYLLIVNFVWSVFNLLPILPLDGGNVCREICTYFSPRNGVRLAAQIGAILAGVICAWCLMQQMFFNAMLIGSLCAQNISIAQQRNW
ncbi:site-2 protease family protein [Thalassoglobus polymorphus]|uniref:Peptidase family M50 n=1 Tax=Thalassoglobus polymorphus TaxID=2527994 RepID=A0A517QT67_9PLAN|nr:site-2 protease family protein [Thalassoglobus polymorphus]QDT34835.1 Peptidase family M50 [Thalassoglobus polymorphus]